jgi:hypothetical protein
MVDSIINCNCGFLKKTDCIKKIKAATDPTKVTTGPIIRHVSNLGATISEIESGKIRISNRLAISKGIYRTKAVLILNFRPPDLDSFAKAGRLC